MIRINQIKVPYKNEKDEHNILKNKIAKKLKISPGEIKDFKIIRKSVDAREKPEIYFAAGYALSVDYPTFSREELLKKAFSSNVNTECHYYPESKRYALVNNTSEKQSTVFYDIEGNQKNYTLSPNEIVWIDVE